MMVMIIATSITNVCYKIRTCQRMVLAATQVETNQVCDLVHSRNVAL